MKYFIHTPKHLRTHTILPGHGRATRPESHTSLPGGGTDVRHTRHAVWAQTRGHRQSGQLQLNQAIFMAALVVMALATLMAFSTSTSALERASLAQRGEVIETSIPHAVDVAELTASTFEVKS